VDTYPDLVNKIMETAPILSGVEPAFPTIPDETATTPLDAQTIPKPEADAVPAKPAEDSPAIPPDDALAAPAPKATKEPSPSASASPPAADNTEAPPVTVPADSVASQLEELQSRNENLQLQVDELESRLQLFSDRLNQLERPEQTRNLTPPLPPDLQAPNNPPDRPSPPEKPIPERRNSYPGGSAT
jgi:septal ring-binding cell division protein DamX